MTQWNAKCFRHYYWYHMTHVFKAHGGHPCTCHFSSQGRPPLLVARGMEPWWHVMFRRVYWGWVYPCWVRKSL